MATRRLTDPIEPMDLANMRRNGVHSLDVRCHNCRHRVIVNVDHLPGDLTVPSFGPQMGLHHVRDDRRRRAAELARLARHCCHNHGCEGKAQHEAGDGEDAKTGFHDAASSHSGQPMPPRIATTFC
jgi:hypothetical protein